MSVLSTKSKSKLNNPAKFGNVEILVGDDVFQLLANKDFQLNWNSLYISCPWSTVYQSREFVTAWYGIYKSKFLPIIVKSDANGKLTSILTLALPYENLNQVNEKTVGRYIVGAGAEQAEYQVWLSATQDSSAFIQEAFSQLLYRFEGFKIQLKYVPGQVSLEWANTHHFWAKHCFVRHFRQPLIIFDEGRINKELRKKNYREKINRLKKLGELKFERIIDRQTFLSVFDELALQYDFRKEAMYNVSFFQDDTLRKDFLLALFDQNLLHITILTLKGEILASNVGTRGNKRVHLQGMNTHAPTFAKYSPGILHFLMLNKLLWEEGMEVFDLTPGDAAYKDALATDYISAFHVEIGSKTGTFVLNARLHIINLLKGLAAKAGVNTNNFSYLKIKCLFIRNKLIRTMLSSREGGLFGSSLKMKQVYVDLENNQLVDHIDDDEMKITHCSLRDLLAYDQLGATQSRWEFLKEAMRRLERGDRSYTWSESGRLLACAWLQTPIRSSDGELREAPKVAVLGGLYCHHSATDRYDKFIRRVALLETCKINHKQIFKSSS